MSGVLGSLGAGLIALAIAALLGIALLRWLFSGRG